MQTYILRRVLLVFPTLIILSIMVFSMIRMVRGDIVDLMADERGGFFAMDSDKIREELGLLKPIHEQYAVWVWGVMRGNFGESLWSRRSVFEEVGRRWPVTLELGLMTILISTVWGVTVGVLTAIKQDTWIDYTLRTVTIMGLSVPYFWSSTLVLLIGSLYFSWSPDPVFKAFPGDPWGNLKQMIVPAIVFSTVLHALVARMTRASVLEVLRQDYVRTARSKGLAEKLVIYRHVLKNAFIPVMSILGVQVAFTIGGSTVMETIWAFPGIGQYTVIMVQDRDYPMLQGIALFLALLIIVTNLIVDISYAWLDPRIRYE